MLKVIGFKNCMNKTTNKPYSVLSCTQNFEEFEQERYYCKGQKTQELFIASKHFADDIIDSEIEVEYGNYGGKAVIKGIRVIS